MATELKTKDEKFLLDSFALAIICSRVTAMPNGRLWDMAHNYMLERRIFFEQQGWDIP